ncbi:MAG: nitrate reductase [Mesorhizobium sp.]|nr:MAG: nitrate reductase [Mesorhizobium sp.]
MNEARMVKTTCPYCGVGCGVLAEVGADGSVSVRGDPNHPANFGRLCSKGSALAEAIGLEGRLLHPEIGARGASWDEALDLVAQRFSTVLAEHGPESVAFYVSGQLLTEDYYLANKLMKGFIGAANIDTNSRLCMASSVAGHRRAFGADIVPGTYEDLELADLVVLVGSNLAWCHPVLYQRIVAAKEKRPEMKLVVIDPRRTMTSDIADLHLAIRPDGDVALFAGLLAWLARSGLLDRDFIAAHTSGLEDARAAAEELSPADTAAVTGLTEAELRAFYELFAHTERTVTVFSQGVNQSISGTDKVNAIINCHLATGRIGRPGMGPFSVTGQPNAMGGREVGGLANMLAAHMEIGNGAHRERVQRFWNAPTIAARPGLKAVDMFRAVADGRIKALWIMATNPVDSMPDADRVREAIAACPFVVVSDISAETDTIRHAHVKLPAAGWGEKDGTVTNSERRISRQRPFLDAPGEARPDWWIICEVAKRMGFRAAFAYASAAEIFAEHAALSGFENDGERGFDIGAYGGINEASYEEMEPFQWPVRADEIEVALSPDTPFSAAARRGEMSGRTKGGALRFFADGRFFTADHKARFIAVRPTPRRETDAEFPLILNTGRVRDHWHTMTRTGKSPRLSQHSAESFVELNPEDAARFGIGDADIVRLASRHGEMLARALLTERQRRGSAFVPMHWTDEFSARARVDALVAPVTDPISGQPASKTMPVRAERFAARMFGFAVLRAKPGLIDADYWGLARCRGGWRLELAWAAEHEDWQAFARSLLGNEPTADLLAYHDAANGRHRFVSITRGRLAGALYLARAPLAVFRNWLVEQLADDQAHSRLALLAGRPGKGQADHGAIVCSCFGVGASQIAAAVGDGCATVEAIGAALQAGTNCGSCCAEINTIIAANRLAAAE